MGVGEGLGREKHRTCWRLGQQATRVVLMPGGPSPCWVLVQIHCGLGGGGTDWPWVGAFQGEGTGGQWDKEVEDTGKRAQRTTSTLIVYLL